MIGRLLKAKKIVDMAQKIAIESQDVIDDENLGFDLTNDHNHSEGLDYLEKLINRKFPYRYDGQNSSKLIRTLFGKDLVQLGNELENGINKKDYPEAHVARIMSMNIPDWEKKKALGLPFSAKDWGAYVVDNCLRNGSEGFVSPSLMTLKQCPIWKKVVKYEDCFEYWALNSHMKSFCRRKESGIGDYIENIKIVSELIHFEELTKKPVIFTELGGGDHHYALGRADVNFLYYIHKSVFGGRMIMGLYYNSAIMTRCMGYNQLGRI